MPALENPEALIEDCVARGGALCGQFPPTNKDKRVLLVSHELGLNGAPITALHTKMNKLRQKQERQKTRALGAASAALSLCLILLVFGAGSARPGGTAGLYSGATMLFEDAGGYVLVSICAFMAGVIITVMLRNKRDKQKREEKSK